MSAETAAYLDEAARIIGRNGLHKGDPSSPKSRLKPSRRPVCTWAALAIAVCGTPKPATNAEVRRMRPAVDALARFLGLDVAASDWAIPNWNDRPGRTTEQVVAALEGAARAEREATS